MIKEGIGPLLSVAARLAKYAPQAASLLKQAPKLRQVSKVTKSRLFKPVSLGITTKVPQRVSPGKWYSPLAHLKRVGAQPARAITDIRSMGAKKWFKGQMLHTKFYVNPKTGLVHKRSIIGRGTQFMGGGTALGGLGFGAADLASGRSPRQAAQTAVGWGVAPTAMMTGLVGKMGYNLLKPKKNKEYNYNY